VPFVKAGVVKARWASCFVSVFINCLEAAYLIKSDWWS